MYGKLEEPDGLGGLLRLRQGPPRLQDQLLAAEKAGSWSEALALHEQVTTPLVTVIAGLTVHITVTSSNDEYDNETGRTVAVTTVTITVMIATAEASVAWLRLCTMSCRAPCVYIQVTWNCQTKQCVMYLTLHS